MASYALDPATGGWQIVNGRLRKLTGAEEKAKKVGARLELALGEWFLDRRIGTPWYELVLVKNPNLEIIKQLFRNVIGSVAGLVEVRDVSINFDREKRLLSYEWEALDEEGTVVSGGSGEPFIVGGE